MRYERTLRFATLCAALAVAPSAHAQAPTTPVDAASAQADDLTHRGVDLLKKHQWAEAEALFRQAWATKHAYDIAGNLGLAEAGLEKWRDASEHLAFALSTFPANGKAAHRELLREKLARVRQELAALTIVVGTPGAEVSVDGRSVGTTPLTDPTFVEPGAHTVEARLAGYEDARASVDATKGAAQTVTLALVVVRSAPPPVAPAVTKPVWPVVVTGIVALGGLVVGASLTVAANGKSDAAATLRAKLGGAPSRCAGSAVGDCADLGDALRAQGALAKGAAGTFVVGGLAAVATVAFGVAVARPARVQVLPTVGTTEGGVAVVGSW